MGFKSSSQSCRGDRTIAIFSQFNHAICLFLSASIVGTTAAFVVNGRNVRSIEGRIATTKSLSYPIPNIVFWNVFHGNRRIRKTFLLNSFERQGNNNAKDDEDDDDDEYLEIDPDSLEDWRSFRRSLDRTMYMREQEEIGNDEQQQSPKIVTATSSKALASNFSSGSGSRVNKDNLNVLKLQNPQLAKEFEATVWAHEIGAVRCNEYSFHE